jgi:hypothetical protein
MAAEGAPGQDWGISVVSVISVVHFCFFPDRNSVRTTVGTYVAVYGMDSCRLPLAGLQDK